MALLLRKAFLPTEQFLFVNLLYDKYVITFGPLYLVFFSFPKYQVLNFHLIIDTCFWSVVGCLGRNDESDSVARMKAAEEALEAKQKVYNFDCYVTTSSISLSRSSPFSSGQLHQIWRSTPLWLPTSTLLCKKIVWLDKRLQGCI